MGASVPFSLSCRLPIEFRLGGPNDPELVREFLAAKAEHHREEARQARIKAFLAACRQGGAVGQT